MAGSGYFFISYARADSAYATAVGGHLEGEGLTVWMDTQIPTGERWDSVLRGRIETCAAMVLVMSPAAGQSEWVAKEVGHARMLGKRIFPLRFSPEILFGLGQIQAETIVHGAMPSAAFVDHLREVVAGRRELRHASGVIPEPADCFQLRDIADQIESAVNADSSAFLTGGSAQILSGLGGVGKTQLAAAAARRARANAEVDLLLWVAATSRAGVMTAYSRAAARLAGADPDDPESAAQAFLEYLACTGEAWLIVLDDLADPSDLNHLWPPRTPAGRVIVTTRRADASLRSHGSVVAVDLFTPAEARQYLAEKFAGDQARLDGADGLAADLGYLPLALAQAAAYIADRQISCARYRSRFADRHQKVAGLAPDSLPDDYTRPLTITLSLTVDAANALPPAGLARPLLGLLSLLDPHGIPADILTSVRLTHYLARNQSPRPEAARLIYADHAHDTLAVLVRLSLATSADGLVRLHGLVQRCAREQAPAGLMAQAAASAAGALLEAWPEVENDPLRSSALRSNAAALRENAGDHLWQPDPHRLFLRAGMSLAESGLTSAALGYWTDLAAQAEARIGRDHPATLTYRHNRALAHEQASQLDQALSEYRAVVADRERVLGPEHPDTLISRGNLARASLSEIPGHKQRSASQIDDAVALATAIHADKDRLLGHEDPRTLISRNDLAHAYQSAGRINEAIALYEATLQTMERVQGPIHRHTLGVRSNLANAYVSADRLDDAILLYEKVITQDVRVLGPHHPDTLVTRANLAHAYASAGRIDDAISLCETAISGYERAIPDHPHIFAIRETLANAYTAVSRFDEAIILHRLDLQVFQPAG
jgi:tetratricopeptide (TPR) repeat protein